MNRINRNVTIDRSPCETKPHGTTVYRLHRQEVQQLRIFALKSVNSAPHSVQTFAYTCTTVPSIDLNWKLLSENLLAMTSEAIVAGSKFIMRTTKIDDF